MSVPERDQIIRFFDVVGAALALLVALPLLALIACLILVFDPGPVIFRHVRVGRNGASFGCLKFRTMVPDAAARLERLLSECPDALAEWLIDHKLRHDPRITPIGRFLRKSSLDELPQLFNVLRGEMSLVGPRPITGDEVPKYGRYIAHYYSTKPGITGLWQVSGRNLTSYRRRVALDVAWARNQCPVLYWRILGRTLPAVMAARGSC